jgi:hypothetical protein
MASYIGNNMNSFYLDQSNYWHMSDRKNKFINLLSIVIIALFLASCTNKDKNSDKKTLQDAKTKYLMETITKNGNDEIISLLSIKYDLDTGLTREIIDDFVQEDSLKNYLSLSDTENIEEFENLKSKIDNRPSVEDRVRKISLENNLGQSKIASLLIDYKIWYEAQNNETY